MHRVLLSIPEPLLLNRLEAELRRDLADRLELVTARLAPGERLSGRVKQVEPDLVVIEVEADDFPAAVSRLQAERPDLVVVGVDRRGEQSGFFIRNAGPEALMRAAASVCDSVRQSKDRQEWEVL